MATHPDFGYRLLTDHFGLEPGWARALEPVAGNLAGMVEVLAEQGEYLPPGHQILRAFHQPFDQVKVLIAGQDPYPTPGHAVGLSFSVSTESEIPKSLQNIYTEYEADLGLPRPTSGDLTGESGVRVRIERCRTRKEKGMPLPTIGQVLQKVDYRQCPMTQELGDAAEDIRELFPEFLSECLNASGQSMDSDYCDIELGEYGDVAHSLIFETDSTIGAVLRANADSRIDIDSIRSLESSGSVTLQDITSLLLNHIAASVANDWARAFEEAGEELEIES